MDQLLIPIPIPIPTILLPINYLFLIPIETPVIFNSVKSILAPKCPT